MKLVYSYKNPAVWLVFPIKCSTNIAFASNM